MSRNKNAQPQLWSRRHEVSEGDIVQVYLPPQGWFAPVGIVMSYISRNEVLVRLVGSGNQAAYNNMVVSLDTRLYTEALYDKAVQNNPNGDDITHPSDRRYIARVIHRVTPLVKKPKPPRKVHVIKTQQELEAALTGENPIERGSHVVLATERAS